MKYKALIIFEDLHQGQSINKGDIFEVEKLVHNAFIINYKGKYITIHQESFNTFISCCEKID